MSANVPAVEIAVRTDPGRDPEKQVNEDSSICKETALGLLAVVCDGMGGHAGGKEASELAIRTIVEIVEAAPAATAPGAALKRAIEEANARIWTMPTAEAGFRPGSTVVAVLAHPAGAEIAHVGDSRIYLLHSGAVAQITRDHSMVQELVDRNLIRAEDAASHPDANKILRALGIAKEVEVELRPEPVPFVTGDIFVLCSDGLSDLVEPAEILGIAGSHPPAQAAGQLVDLANARGGHDNITAMVLRMKTSAAARDAATILKTMPITQNDTAPGGGPTGTMLSPAMVAPPPAGATQVTAPLDSVRRPPQPIVLPRAEPPRDSRTPGARGPGLAIGIVLALVAVAILGAGVFVAIRPERKSVPVVEDRHHDAGTESGEDASTEFVASPAPTLGGDGAVSAAPVPTPVPTPLPRDPNEPDACWRARRARANKAPDSILRALDKQCQSARGGP